MKKLVLIVILLFAVGWTMESEASHMGLSPPGVEQVYIIDVETQIVWDVVLMTTPQISVSLINTDIENEAVMELTGNTKTEVAYQKQEREAIGVNLLNNLSTKSRKNSISIEYGLRYEQS